MMSRLHYEDAVTQARAWLTSQGRNVEPLFYNYRHKSGEHLFRGKEVGYRATKRAKSRKGSRPSDTVRLRAIVEEGKIVKMEDITTSDRKRLSAPSPCKARQERE